MPFPHGKSYNQVTIYKTSGALIILFACREQFFEHERTPIQPDALDTVLHNGDCIQGALSLGIVSHHLASNEITSELNLWLINQINFGTFPPQRVP